MKIRRVFSLFCRHPVVSYSTRVGNIAYGVCERCGARLEATDLPDPRKNKRWRTKEDMK